MRSLFLSPSLKFQPLVPIHFIPFHTVLEIGTKVGDGTRIRNNNKELGRVQVI